MYIELTPEQRQLQAELRQYFSNLISPEEATGDGDRPARQGLPGDHQADGHRRQARRRLAKGVRRPRVSGPSNSRSSSTRRQRADVPLPAVTLQTVGPTLQQYGTELQKKKFLPGILSGDVHFAIGYSEPEAGTDLASLRTTAVRHGDEYIVNGQKILTTGGHDADYVWLAVRTDPEAVKHKGISILIVDTIGSRLLLDADHPVRRRAPHQRHVLQRRAGAGRHARRRGERRLAADHHAAQPRARDARPRGQGRGHLRQGARVGVQARRQRRHPARPR